MIENETRLSLAEKNIQGYVHSDYYDEIFDWNNTMADISINAIPRLLINEFSFSRRRNSKISTFPAENTILSLESVTRHFHPNTRVYTRVIVA